MRAPVMSLISGAPRGVCTPLHIRDLWYVPYWFWVKLPRILMTPNPTASKEQSDLSDISAPLGGGGIIFLYKCSLIVV